MLCPRRVGPGARIGVVAPSSPIRYEKLEAGVAALQGLGFKVEVAPHVYDRWGYLAGLDHARAADLTEMFRNDDIDAIICARGGYGAARMVEMVDWSVVRDHPKVFVGYSDITILHLAAEKFADLATFHGPMVTTFASPIGNACLRSFMDAVTSADAPRQIGDPDRPARTLVGGRTTGRLAGGCMTLLCSALGTPYQPDFTGRIVVLEDTDEALYRVDRMLIQLLSSGVLERASGFVVGTVSNLTSSSDDSALCLDDLWRGLLAPLGKPAILGFPIGHVEDPLTLPLGRMAELDADSMTLRVTEACVSA